MEKKSEMLLDIDEELAEIKPQRPSFFGVLITFFGNLLGLVVMLPLFGFFTVAPQEEVIILYWGKMAMMFRKPGFYYFPLIGRTLIRISTKTETIDVKKTTVVDANGNPIIISGVVTYRVVETVKAAFNVTNIKDYLSVQSLAILKKVASKYPYESKDGHSLHREPDVVSKEMVSFLQLKGNICGSRIISYELCDLQYAPEIAQGMLVRQQAQALLDARKVIVDGAIGIVTHAVHGLAESGVKLSSSEQSRLVSNLLSVICAETRVQPTLSIGESNSAEKENSAEEYHRSMMKILETISFNTRPQK